MGLFFDDKACIQQPCRLHRHDRAASHGAGYILGVDPKGGAPAHCDPPGDDRPIADPYICIGVQATTQAKKWNNPDGWIEIVLFA